MSSYFNTAAFGLIGDSVKASADAFYAGLATGGSTVAEHWRDTVQPLIRQSLAEFLQAPAEQVAMIPNFSWGLNALVHNLRGSERVLLYRGDYASVCEPFVINGFPVTWIEAEADFRLPVDDILQRIGAGALDIAALSHVQYNSGYVLDVERIGAACREHGAWLIVDATQSLGALPLNLGSLPVDVLIASHYKWMNAGFGTGSLYCSAAFLEAYPPKTGGANSYGQPGLDWREETPIRAWEPGHPNMYGLQLLGAAIRERMETGVGAVAAANLGLSEYFIEGIRGKGLPLIGPESMENRCPILVFRDEDGLSERLRAAGIVATFRGGRVRISFHTHNTRQETDLLLEVLAWD